MFFLPTELVSLEQRYQKSTPSTGADPHRLGCRTTAMRIPAGGRGEGLPLYRRAFDGYERLLGLEHSDTLISANNLAGCLRGARRRGGLTALPARCRRVREIVRPGASLQPGGAGQSRFARARGRGRTGQTEPVRPSLRRAKWTRGENRDGSGNGRDRHPPTLRRDKNDAGAPPTARRGTQKRACNSGGAHKLYFGAGLS
jgi:hypothetical protein